MSDNPSREPLELSAVLRVLVRRRALVLICTLVAPIAAITLTISEADVYEASASLLFRDPGFDDKILGGQSVEPADDPERAAATNLELVSLDRVVLRAAMSVGRGLTEEDIENSIEVVQNGDSNVITVIAQAAQPETAAAIANAVTTEFIEFRLNSDRTKLMKARRLIEREIASLPETATTRLRDLRVRAERLDTLASLQTGNAELVQPATLPKSPLSKGLVQKAVLALLAGGLLGAALALIVDRLDRRLHSVDDATAIFARPIVGTVSLQRGERAKQALSSRSLDTGPVESFRILRTNLLYFNVDRRLRSILVTSSMSGEGKSTVSWNLALAATGSGARVMLIEADLRQPVLGSRLGLPAASGLSAFLTGSKSLEDVTTSLPTKLGDGVEGNDLHIVLAGHLPPNPADLVESVAMRNLLRSAEEQYDLVVIDTPPTTFVSDAIPLTREVSGILVVARIGTTTRDAAKKLVTQLDNVGASILGIVINAVPAADENYYGTGYRQTVGEKTHEVSSTSTV